MRWCLAILSLALSIPAAAAQDFSWPTGGSGTSSSGTSDQDEYHSETDASFPQESHNPDASQQKRLVVEWGKVSMGYVDYASSVANGDPRRRTWKDDHSLRADRALALRGRLLIESAGGKRREPIDWVQGVRVVVSRLPEKKYDWSRRQEMHEAVWGDFVIREKGEFLATVSPGEVCRSVGRESRFQVALSLGEKDWKRITWKNTVAVLPQSVAMLKIPGPPAIGETLQIINGAPSYDQNDFNPAKLVRAVNHLLPMGKEKAIRQLRAFLKIARDSTNETVRREENIDTSDRTCVFLIVRLLFECAEPKGELPDIATVPFTPYPDEVWKKLWPLHPLYLEDDLPFFLVNGGCMDEQPDRPERHVDWAEKHGKLRSKPLRPLDNPMAAANRLVTLPQTKLLYKDQDFKDLLYRQAWNIIEDVDPRIPKPKPIPPVNTWDRPDWDARVKAASKFKIHWSEAGQRYIME